MSSLHLSSIPYIKKMICLGVLYAMVEACFFLGIGLVAQNHQILEVLIISPLQFIIVLILLKIVGSNWLFKVFANARFDAITVISKALVGHVASVDAVYVSAAMSRRYTEDVNLFINVYVNNSIFILSEFLLLIVLLAFLLFSVESVIVSIAILSSLSLLSLNWIASYFSKRFGKHRRDFEEKRLNYTLSALSEPEWIMSDVSEPMFNKTFSEILGKIRKYGSLTLLMQQLPRAVIEALGLGFVGFCFVYISQAQSLSLGGAASSFSALFLVAMRTIPSMSKMSVLRQGIQMNRYAIEFIQSRLLELDLSIIDRDLSASNLPSAEATTGWSKEAECISAKDVNIALIRLGVNASKEINFTFGNSYLVTGASGTGKTLFIKKMFEEKKELMSVAYLPQKPILLDFHILHLLNLSIQKYGYLIEALAIGEVLDTFVECPNISERIETLSAGECQRLGMAYVFTTDSNLLLFDEPIANLSADFSYALSALMKKYASNACSIIVSHQRIDCDDEIFFSRLD